MERRSSDLLGAKGATPLASSFVPATTRSARAASAPRCGRTPTSALASRPGGSGRRSSRRTSDRPPLVEHLHPVAPLGPVVRVPSSVRGGLRQPPSTPTARKRRAAERVQPVVPQGVQPWAAPAGTLDHVRLPRPLVALQEPRVRRGVAKRQEGAAVQTRPDALRRHLRLREAGLLPSSDALDEHRLPRRPTPLRPQAALLRYQDPRQRASAASEPASSTREDAAAAGTRSTEDVLVLVDVRRVDLESLLATKTCEYSVE